jgi:hypothetical protein
MEVTLLSRDSDDVAETVVEHFDTTGVDVWFLLFWKKKILNA